MRQQAPLPLAVVATLLGALLGTADALQWHAGCMCELKSGAAARTSMMSLFEGYNYRRNGVNHQFCPCGVETVQELNDEFVHPVLDQLRKTPFFAHYRVSLLEECPFWNDDGYCMIKDCSVEEDDAHNDEVYTELDVALDQPTLKMHWPSELDDTWTNEDENTDLHYVDLTKNPERYTGYKGESPHRIWENIYRHNMFDVPEDGEDDRLGQEAMKLEHKVFYKLVSGVHASISSHIAWQYLLNEEECTSGPNAQVWGPHLDEFERRFVGHPQRENNLYFVYLLTLRAVTFAAPTLLEYNYTTGHHRDAQTPTLVHELLSSHEDWPLSVDETKLFQGRDAAQLEHAFRSRVLNMSRVMDCVGCERCRLWGKLQFMGLGTALRILFSPDRQAVLRGLHRNHVVALINFLARLSHSVRASHLLHGLYVHSHQDAVDATSRATGLLEPGHAHSHEIPSWGLGAASSRQLHAASSAASSPTPPPPPPPAAPKAPQVPGATPAPPARQETTTKRPPQAPAATVKEPRPQQTETTTRPPMPAGNNGGDDAGGADSAPVGEASGDSSDAAATTGAPATKGPQNGAAAARARAKDKEAQAVKRGGSKAGRKPTRNPRASARAAQDADGAAEKQPRQRRPARTPPTRKGASKRGK